MGFKADNRFKDEMLEPIMFHRADMHYDLIDLVMSEICNDAIRGEYESRDGYNLIFRLARIQECLDMLYKLVSEE